VVIVDDPNLGHVVNGRWRLDERLGQGGMGTVYRAEELSVGRPVAIKFLHVSLLKDAESIARFEQEARSMARCDHPNLVHLYAVERDGDVPCIVMKYVPGRRLSALFRDKGLFTLTEALPLVVQIGSALSALHAQGFVHRDLKPGNVMVAEDGFATLLDFGLMRSSNTSLTRPGTILGTPHYMAPEQAIGSPLLDGRSDQYALAVLTTELVCGELPFLVESTGEMLASRVTQAPTPPSVLNPNITADVSDVLMRAMEREPSERFADVDAFLDALIDAARVGPVGLPRRRLAELKLVKGSKPDGVQIAEVLSLAQLENMGLSSADLSQVPDAEVVSLPAAPARTTTGSRAVRALKEHRSIREGPAEPHLGEVTSQIGSGRPSPTTIHRSHELELTPPRDYDLEPDTDRQIRRAPQVQAQQTATRRPPTPGIDPRVAEEQTIVAVLPRRRSVARGRRLMWVSLIGGAVLFGAFMAWMTLARR
jgi:serine/threonine protein kinase